jgi:hypothetical protein
MNASKIGNYNAMNRIAKTIRDDAPTAGENRLARKHYGALYSIAPIHYSE